MHRFLFLIKRILQINRLMEVAHAVVEGALKSLGSAPGGRSFNSQSDMRIANHLGESTFDPPPRQRLPMSSAATI
jgi:hypothetical protein